jgi:hypothetical protein
MVDKCGRSDDAKQGIEAVRTLAWARVCWTIATVAIVSTSFSFARIRDEEK